MSSHAFVVGVVSCDLSYSIFRDEQLLLPMFMEKCKEATHTAASDLRTVDDDTYLMLEIFAEVYGYFLVAMTPLFPDEETWTTGLNALRRMVTCNGPTVRHWCAFNLPAVATTCGVKRPDRIKGVLQALSTDTDVETRATLAAGIHETTRILAGGELREELISALGELMTDINPQVRLNALLHFAEVLEMLSKDEPAAKHLGGVFTNLDMLSQDSWRTQKVLAEQLDRAANLIPQEMLCEYVAPILFQIARESTYLVRNTAIAAIVRVLRYIPTTKRRDHILNHFIKEWAQGKVYWTRLAYLDGVDAGHGIFSRALFKKLFVEESLKMHKDSVPNVRLRLVKVMRNIIGSCKDMPLYREALEKLLTDKDKQVSIALSIRHAFPYFSNNTALSSPRRPSISTLRKNSTRTPDLKRNCESWVPSHSLVVLCRYPPILFFCLEKDSLLCLQSFNILFMFPQLCGLDKKILMRPWGSFRFYARNLWVFAPILLRRHLAHVICFTHAKTRYENLRWNARNWFRALKGLAERKTTKIGVGKMRRRSSSSTRRLKLERTRGAKGLGWRGKNRRRTSRLPMDEGSPWDLPFLQMLCHPSSHRTMKQQGQLEQVVQQEEWPIRMWSRMRTTYRAMAGVEHDNQRQQHSRNHQERRTDVV